MSQTWKIIVAVVITAVVVGGGVYLWQADGLTVKIEKNNDSALLTKEYLVSSYWGQEGPYGAGIKFNTDGTFKEGFAGETGDLPTSGSFTIKNNFVILKTEKYAGVSFNEAKEKYGDNAIYIPERMLTLYKSDNSLLFTHFLVDNGRIAYWNKSSKVPEDSKRIFASYIVTTIQKNLKPKINTTVKNYPHANSAAYRFFSCEFDSECGTPYALAAVYKGVIARTKFKDNTNGIEDYWYLVNIEVPWYSEIKLNNERATNLVDYKFAWIHGSELE